MSNIKKTLLGTYALRHPTPGFLAPFYPFRRPNDLNSNPITNCLGLYLSITRIFVSEILRTFVPADSVGFLGPLASLMSYCSAFSGTSNPFSIFNFRATYIRFFKSERGSFLMGLFWLDLRLMISLRSSCVSLAYMPILYIANLSTSHMTGIYSKS